MKVSLREGDLFGLQAISKYHNKEKKQLIFGTDLYVEIPFGCVGIIKPLDSLYDTLLEFEDIYLRSGWHQIEVVFGRGSRPKKNYEIGDVVAQLEVKKCVI